MCQRRHQTLKLGIVFGVVAVVLNISLLACGSLPASASPPSMGKRGVVMTLTWDEWQDLSNCVLFVADDMRLTLDVARNHLDATTKVEADATVDRLTQLGAKLDAAAQDSSAGMSAEALQAILDAQLTRTRHSTDLQTRLFDARMDALVSP